MVGMRFVLQPDENLSNPLLFPLGDDDRNDEDNGPVVLAGFIHIAIELLFGA
jgi:hypothetical protein